MPNETIERAAHDRIHATPLRPRNFVDRIIRGVCGHESKQALGICHFLQQSVALQKL